MYGAFDDLFSGGSSSAPSEKSAPADNGGSAFDKLFGTSSKTPTSTSAKPAPTPIIDTKMQTWNGQQIPASIPTKNLVAYDAKTGIKSFKLPGGNGVYSEDSSGNIVKGGHTTYGNVAPVKGQQRDDIIPVGLGGTNSSADNIRMVPEDVATKQDPIEAKLASDVKKGIIQPKAAINSALRQKSDIANEPSTLEKIGNFFENIGTGVNQSIIQPAKKLIAPLVDSGVIGINGVTGKDTIKNQVDTVKSIYTGTVSDVKNSVLQANDTITKYRDIQNDPQASKTAKTASSIETAASVANAVFTGIAAATGFDELFNAPAIKNTVGKVFSVAGEKGGNVLATVVDKATSHIPMSAEDRASLNSSVKTIGSLLTQIGIGEGVFKAPEMRDVVVKGAIDHLTTSVDFNRQIAVDISAGKTVPPEVYDAYKNLSPEQKSAVGKGVLTSLPGVNPNVLGKMLGLTKEEAIALRQAKGQPVLSKPIPAKPLQIDEAKAVGQETAPASNFDVLHDPNAVPVVSQEAPVIAGKAFDTLHQPIQSVASEGPTRVAVTPVAGEKLQSVSGTYTPKQMEQLFKSSVRDYQQTGISHVGDTQPVNQPLKILGELADKPAIKMATQEKVRSAVASGELHLNSDGTVTVYRVGSIPESDRLVSAAMTPEAADEFKLNHPEATVTPVKIKPAKIQVYIGGMEKEVLLKASDIRSTQGSDSNKLPGIKPIKVKQTGRIEELRTQISALEEALSNSPLKRLSKYSSNGQLPEVTGERGGSAFKQKGDSVVQEVATELGHPEWGTQEISDAYEKYAQGAKSLKTLRSALQETNKIVFEDYTPEQLDRINTMAQMANSHLSEAGFFKPGDIVSDIAKATKEGISTAKEFIQATQENTAVSKNTADDLYKLRTNSIADAILAKKFLQNTKITQADAEALYHYDEDKSSPITDEQKKLYDTEIKPLADATNRMVAKLKPTMPLTKEDYTPRFVRGKGSMIDRLAEVADGIKEKLTSGVKIGGGSMLSRSAPSLKRRVMMAIEDDNGNRTVVSIKKGRVTAFKNNIRQDLGPLNLTTKATLMASEIKPIQSGIDRIQREIDILKSVKTREPISTASVTNIENKIAEISKYIDDRVGVLTNQELKPDLIKLRKLETKLEILGKVKSADQVVLTKTRIATLEKKMLELVNKMAEIEAKYNPNDLSGRKFVKDGKTYKITDATTKEIEANTALRYNKNVLANRVFTYLKLRQIERANAFVEAFKNSPGFDDIAMEIGKGDAPANWRQTNLIQFRNYLFEPHMAAVLDDFAGRVDRGEDPLSILSATNRFLRSAIFFNPLLHIPNIADHWFVDRGLTPLLKPKDYIALKKTSVRAIKAVMNQNADYIAMLREGAPMMSGDQNNQELYKVLVEKMTTDMQKDPEFEKVAKQLGYVNPINWIKQIYKMSGKITWLSNDIATMQRIYERMNNGLTLPEAIAETGKHIPNYRIPATVMNSEKMAKFLKNPNITLFGAYHYGALKSYVEMAKDGLGPKSTKAQRMDAVNHVLAWFFAAIVIYPLVDKIIQKITNNPNASIRRSGSHTFTSNVYKFATGQEDLATFLQSIVTPAAGTKEAIQLGTNTDLFTKSRIYSASQGPVGEVAAAGAHAIQAIAPVQQATNIKNGKKIMGDWLWGLMGVSMTGSKAFDNNIKTMIYDEKPQLSTQVKDLYNQGKQDEADQIIINFNDRLFSTTVKALKQDGYAIPDDATIDEKLKNDYLKPPTDTQLNNRKATKSTPFLEGIFNGKKTAQ